MSQTVGYILFGTLTILFVLAWGFYVRKLGGFIEYVNRPWQSIAIFAAALVVGFAVYYVALATMKYPSAEEIRKAPSWKETERFLRTGESPDDNKTYEESVGEIKDDEEEKAPDSDGVRRYNPIDAAKEGKRRVVMNAKDVWREKLETERDNAKLDARKTGIAAGLLAATVGYALLGMGLARKRAEQDALAAEADAAVPPPAPPANRYTDSDLRFEQGAPPRAPEPPPVPDATADAPPAESGDAPISIDDLDKDYQQYLKDKEGRR